MGPEAFGVPELLGPEAAGGLGYIGKVRKLSGVPRAVGVQECWGAPQPQFSPSPHSHCGTKGPRGAAPTPPGPTAMSSTKKHVEIWGKASFKHSVYYSVLF